jgi:hypothetical protein
VTDYAIWVLILIVPHNLGLRASCADVNLVARLPQCPAERSPLVRVKVERLKFALDFQGDGQRHRRHHPDQQRRDRRIDDLARHRLTRFSGTLTVETSGAWENFSTPSWDLRLLIAIDVVRIPDRVAAAGALCPARENNKAPRVVPRATSARSEWRVGCGAVALRPNSRRGDVEI